MPEVDLNNLPGLTPVALDQLPGLTPLAPVAPPAPHKVKVIDGRGRVVEIDSSEFQQITPGTPAERRGFGGQFWEALQQAAYDSLPPGLRWDDPNRALGGEGSSGIGGFVGNTLGGFAGLAGNAEQLPANILGAMTGGGTRAVGIAAKAAGLESQVLRRAGGTAAKELAELGAANAAKAATLKTTKGLLLNEAKVNATQGAALSGLQAISETSYDDFVEDPLGTVGDVVGAAALGGLAGAAAGVGLASTIKVLSETKKSADFQRAKNRLVKEKIFTPEEIKLIGKRPELVVGLAIQRLDGNDVTITDGGNGKPRIKVIKTGVPWEVRQALEFNPELIKFYGESVKNGARPFDLVTPKGPASAGELQTAQKSLGELSDRLKAALKPEDVTQAGAPATERALLYRDAQLLLRRSVTPETSRLFVNQVEGLLQHAKSVEGSTKLISAETANAALAQPDILSPIPKQAQPKLALPLLEAKRSGYLRRAEELTKSATAAKRITDLQRRAISQLQVLRSDSRFSDIDKYRVARILDNEYVAKVDEALKKGNNRPRAARARVVKALEAVNLPEAELRTTIDGVEQALDKVMTKFSDETQLGTVDRLLAELADPNYRVNSQGLRAIEGLRERLINDRDALPATDRARAAGQELKDFLLTRVEVPKAREELARLAKELPDSVARPFLAASLELHDEAGVRALAQGMLVAQENYRREVATRNLSEIFGKLSTTTQRTKLESLLKSIDPKLAEPRETIGPVTLKVGDKIYTGEPKDLHATLLTRLVGENLEPTPAPAPAAVKTKTKPTKQATKPTPEPWDMTPSQFLDWTRTKEFKEARARAEAVEVAAQRRVSTLEEQVGSSSKSPLEGIGSVEGLSPAAFGIAQLAGSLRQQRLFEEALAKMPAAFRLKYEAAIKAYDLAHARVRTFEDLNTAKEQKALLVDKAAEFNKQVDEALDAGEAANIKAQADAIRSGSPEAVRSYNALKARAKVNPDGQQAKEVAAIEKLLKAKPAKTSKKPAASAPKEPARSPGALPLAEAKKLSLAYNADPEAVSGFSTSKRAHVDRATAEGIAKAPATGKIENPKSLLKTNKETGYTELDEKALVKALETKSVDDLEQLQRRAQYIVRQGQIERGLYAKVLKYSTAEDAKGVQRTLARKKVLKQRSDVEDTLRHVAKLAYDPAMYEAKLLSRSRGASADPLYEIFHGNLRQPMREHQQNAANTRRYAAALTKKYFGIDPTDIDGQVKLGKYLNEDLGDGVSRNAAMWSYALSTDEGRTAALKTAKIEIGGQVKDPEAAIAKLTVPEREYVRELKAWFDRNPVVEKAFSNFVVQHGYEPERVRGWFTSSRQPGKVKLDADFGTFTASLIQDIDPLRRRTEGSDRPFQVDEGFYTAFLNAADKISMYAEVGPALNRAERVFIDKDVRSSWLARYGEADYRSFELYLSSIAGQVGHSRTALDEGVNRAISGFQVSRVAWNLFSATKQGLHVLTLYGDGTIEASAITQALKERAAFSKSIDKRMIENSGMAYLRYTGGRFLENILVLGKDTRLPSKRMALEHKSMFLQRNTDRAVMRTAWRASEIAAERLGLKGDAALEHTRTLFEVAAGRDQPTDNPLYASELELQAKRQPLLRGAVMFMREQNRIYNMMRRHVVEAVQNPSPTNTAKAARALFFGVFANAVGVSGINMVRRAAFGETTKPEQVTNEAVDSMLGSFYLLSPTGEIFKSLFAGEGRTNRDRFLGPVGSLLADAGDVLIGTNQALTAEGEVESGVRRGQSKSSRGLALAVDKAMSVASAASGLPFWGAWYQAKGLYNWVDDDFRLMSALEAERAQLKDAGLEKSSRWREIEETKSRINEIHRNREAGVLTREAAQRRIVNELERSAR